MTQQTENFAELFEKSFLDIQMRSGALLDATVVAIGNDFVRVAAGLKADSYIAKSEFLDENREFHLNVGDVVKVVLLQFDDEGETILSRDSAKRLETLERLEHCYKNQETVMGVITSRVKGGFTVEIGNVRAFLPGSLNDLKGMRETAIDDKPLEFKVIKLDRKRNNIVVSRRAVLDAETSAERSATLENLFEGKVIQGTVKNLLAYGAFIDLGGGVDGLLHKSDIAWTRINHPDEKLHVGQAVDVMVLKIDRERGRVSLGIKQLDADPWQNLAKDFPKGSKFKGEVTNILDYGCFVKIKEGVEGLVHQSEMSWTNKNVPPNKVVQVGQPVEVMVLEIDEERRRISLGIKQCMLNPWEQFVATHARGEKISGTIKSITDFGIFIGLEGDIDGLVHTSDISWNIPGEVAIRDYKKGQEISAVILAMDAERERISLGIKQIESDPFTAYVESNQKGASVKGRVVEVDAKQATVELMPEVFGIIKASEVAREKTEDVRNVLKEGDEVEAKITNIDRKTRVITLSIKAHETQAEAELTREYSKSEGLGATLGDLLKDQINNNKE